MAVYAVRVGRQRGIFEDWNSCSASVMGFSGSEYKKFSTVDEAAEYLDGNVIKKAKGVCISPLVSQFDIQTEIVTLYDGSEGVIPENCAVAYSDGSYDEAKKKFGYAGVICTHDKKYTLAGADRHEDFGRLRNVAGEILGALSVLHRAQELGITDIKVFVDYQGLVAWTTGEWAARSNYAVLYKDYIAVLRRTMNIELIWVKGHSGVPGNHEVDRLASRAVSSGKTTDCTGLLTKIASQIRTANSCYQVRC